ncbi:MAG TPA: hypothetical protein VGC79_34430 [Polyangiaceae bacterium]
MQQTKSYWRMLAVGSVVSAFIASACVITATDDDTNTAGSGGSGTSTGGSTTGGSSTAGSSTAGSGTAGSHAGTAGSSAGSASVPFQCDPEGEGGAQGDGNSCEPTVPGDDCQICIQGQCCAQFAACYATDPGNQCGWGGPATIDGEKNEGGELACVQICLAKAVEKSGTAPTDTEVQTCAANCSTTLSNGATTECGSVIGLQTSAMVACLRDHCSLPCFGAE